MFALSRMPIFFKNSFWFVIFLTSRLFFFNISINNFKLFSESLAENNLAVKKIITQSEFLKKVGILERADILSKKMTFKEKANMFYRLKRLIDPKEMGDRFKVIFAQKKDKIFSLGF